MFEDIVGEAYEGKTIELDGVAENGDRLTYTITFRYADTAEDAYWLYEAEEVDFVSPLPDAMLEQREAEDENWSAIPELNTCTLLFNTNSEEIYNQLETWGKNLISPYLSGLTSIVSGVGSSLVKIFKFLYNMLIGLIVACYLLSSRKRFARQSVMVVRSLLKPRWADLFLGEVAFVDRMFGGFIDGKLLDSAIIGVLCYLGCLLFRFPNALLVSTCVGITNVIPFFGPFIGAVPSTLLIMIANPMKGL